jgi:hypothetical protein
MNSMPAYMTRENSGGLSRLTSHDPSQAARVVSETGTILFLGGCVLALLVGCGLRVEGFVAYWDSFENFVRAVVG